MVFSIIIYLTSIHYIKTGTQHHHFIFIIKKPTGFTPQTFAVAHPESHLLTQLIILFSHNMGLLSSSCSIARINIKLFGFCIFVSI